MHQNKYHHTTPVTIRPFDIIYYENGSGIDRGLVLQTEPMIGACKLDMTEDNDDPQLLRIQKLGFIGTISAHQIMTTRRAEIDQEEIEAALATQFGGYDPVYAQQVISEARQQPEVTIVLGKIL